MRTEHHFFKVSELEVSRLKQQIKQLEKSMTDLEGYEENLQSMCQMDGMMYFNEIAIFYR